MKMLAFVIVQPRFTTGKVNGGPAVFDEERPGMACLFQNEKTARFSAANMNERPMRSYRYDWIATTGKAGHE